MIKNIILTGLNNNDEKKAQFIGLVLFYCFKEKYKEIIKRERPSNL